jgi:hypothetical protein
MILPFPAKPLSCKYCSENREVGDEINKRSNWKKLEKKH